jgi:Fe-S-cluster containining protein
MGVPTRGGPDNTAGRDAGNPCDGCHDCGLRCTAGIQMTEPEFLRIVEHLRTLDPRQVTRVLEQEKMVVWFEEIESEACLFYDVPKQRCIVYPARPFVCRLFGRVEWMPCPEEKDIPHIKNGLRLTLDYAGEERATFPEWCAALGHFDIRQLTSE